jgi:thiol-disulfide isomerase/thioredoxin
MRFNFISKILIIFFLVLFTYLYAAWEKKKYYSHDENYSASLVLKELPTFNIYSLDSKKILISPTNVSSSRAVFIHLWGTWCAPCEREMPEFLSFAEKVKSKGVQFYLIAVGDELINVKKFLKKFPVLPENVTIAIDLDNTVMDLFGTLKVPETFLFNSNGKHINKFVGPQEWSQESYVSRLDSWLSVKNQ